MTIELVGSPGHPHPLCMVWYGFKWSSHYPRASIWHLYSQIMVAPLNQVPDIMYRQSTWNWHGKALYAQIIVLTSSVECRRATKYTIQSLAHDNYNYIPWEKWWYNFTAGRTWSVQFCAKIYHARTEIILVHSIYKWSQKHMTAMSRCWLLGIT